MVEGQRQAPVPGIEDGGPAGVVGPARLPRGPGQEDRRDGVEAGVPGGVGIGAQLPDELDVEGRLLAGLADGGRFERFPVVDKSARQRPAGRGVPALDKNDAAALPAVHDLDDDVHRREGIAVLGAPHRRPSGPL